MQLRIIRLRIRTCSTQPHGRGPRLNEKLNDAVCRTRHAGQVCFRSYLKDRIWAQGSAYASRLRCDKQGGTKFPRKAGFPIWLIFICGSQPASPPRWIEELKRGPNVEIGLKDIFEMTSS